MISTVQCKLKYRLNFGLETSLNIYGERFLSSVRKTLVFLIWYHLSNKNEAGRDGNEYIEPKTKPGAARRPTRQVSFTAPHFHLFHHFHLAFANEHPQASIREHSRWQWFADLSLQNLSFRWNNQLWIKSRRLFRSQLTFKLDSIIRSSIEN